MFDIMKIYVDFKTTIKNSEKVFRLFDNCISIGCWKVFLSGQEYLSSAVIVLKNSAIMSDLTKRGILQLNSFQNDETI